MIMPSGRLVSVGHPKGYPAGSCVDRLPSSGKQPNGFSRTATKFTLCVLGRYGLRDHGPAGPTLAPQIRFLYIASRLCSTFP